MPERLKGFTSRRYVNPRYLHLYLYLYLYLAQFSRYDHVTGNRRMEGPRTDVGNHRIAGLTPLDSKGNYSATSNNTKLVDWPLMGRLLHLVQRGGAWAGCDSAQSALFSSLWRRQPLNCLALRPPIRPNALPLINQVVIEISLWFLQTSRE